MSSSEVPKTLREAVDNLNATQERLYERKYEEFLQVMSTVSSKARRPDYSTNPNWYTPRIPFEVDGEEYVVWMEETSYAENGGSNEVVTLTVAPKDYRSKAKKEIFSWSSSMQIQDKSTALKFRGSVRDTKIIDGYIEIMQYIAENIPQDDSN